MDKKIKRLDMTREEINKYIHVEILGKCWHSRYFWRNENWCPRCTPIPTEGDIYVSYVPDYCSDDSPRRLLNEVVAKVIELGRREEFMIALVAECRDITVRLTGPNTPSEQIATACVLAHKATIQEMEKENE